MRKTKKLAALMLAGAMAASLAACGGQTASTDTTAAESADGEESKEAEQTADGETYKIGVLQLTQHVALDKTNEGFVAALDDAGIKYEIDQQNAAGEQSACQTIAEKLVNDFCIAARRQTPFFRLTWRKKHLIQLVLSMKITPFPIPMRFLPL